MHLIQVISTIPYPSSYLREIGGLGLRKVHEVTHIVLALLREGLVTLVERLEIEECETISQLVLDKRILHSSVTTSELTETYLREHHIECESFISDQISFVETT